MGNHFKTIAERDIYRKAINDIDDYFEYANESAKDRQKVYSILDSMTKELSDLYNKDKSPE